MFYIALYMSYMGFQYDTDTEWHKKIPTAGTKASINSLFIETNMIQFTPYG